MHLFGAGERVSQLLPAIRIDWMADFEHAFLLRDPRLVVASYLEIVPQPTTSLGYHQLAQVMGMLDVLDVEPLVFDASAFRANPISHLRFWCAELGIDYANSMLTWEPGEHPQDPPGDDPWYRAIKASSGFLVGVDDPDEAGARVSEANRGLYEYLVSHTMPVYEALRERCTSMQMQPEFYFGGAA